MIELVKKTKSNLPGPGPGRPKGGRNKTTGLLKEAILMAAAMADPEPQEGAEGTLEGYLKWAAKNTPGPFLGLIGKVLPLTLSGDPHNPLMIVSKEQKDAATEAFLRSKS